ncbi:hypothetical protein Vafri_17312 [Volvox africanus]|uniref:FAD-binding domain-containing protein n=1 Tax=Volvox africanus TaxID=51714 RepID=A0A8J4F7F4_9CHLO|nr:hypothetical protein Vafri_17312 [Volvox africanus]
MEPCDALIVGAGPAGLGTALLLIRREPWKKIIILERRPAVDVEDLDKSYVYKFDARGRSLTDAAGLSQAVEEAGMAGSSVSWTYVRPDGTTITLPFFIKGNEQYDVFITRSGLLKVMYEGLAKAEQQGRVRIIVNARLTTIQLQKDSAATAPIVVRAVYAAPGGDGKEMSFAPRLLVGADGINSSVRRALADWAPEAGLPADHFNPVVLNSPSSGLRFKVLQLPPNPPFRKPPSSRPASACRPDRNAATTATNVNRGGTGNGGGDTTNGVLTNQQFFRVLGVDAPPNRIVRLGLFPVKDSKAPRTANIIKPNDHVFWTLTTGPQLGAFLQESFPQLDISALFTEEQLQAVAASRGGVFPRPQYLKHFTAVLQQSCSSSALSSTASDAPPAAVAGPCCGVALVGDAVHCFPPDLGQGVNSAMQDVVGLAQALDDGDGDLVRALPLYETRRAPEAAALAELITFGAPYQYAQDMRGHNLWQANIRFRAFMAKLAPWAFSPQTFPMVQGTELSYVQIRDRVHATTKRLWALGLMVATAVGAVAFHRSTGVRAS